MSHKMPVIGHHRGVPIFDFQDEDRINDIVKPEIDRIHAMNDIDDLYEYACEPFQHPPEARLFAAAKIKAAFETRASAHESRGGVDVDRLTASVSWLGNMGPFGQAADYYTACPNPPDMHRNVPRRPAHHAARYRAAMNKIQEERRAEWQRTHGDKPAVEIRG